MKSIIINTILIITSLSSVDDLIILFEINNSINISGYLNTESQIIIDEKIHIGNSYQQSLVLDDFFDVSKVDKFKVIHRGGSENNLIYILGEYSSNTDIYKVLITLTKSEKELTIKKIKIDKKL
tara:strand:+ start:33839 stop:34210 length:372 start_codon:yes stop_codon:yes gene_type:complete